MPRVQIDLPQRFDFTTDFQVRIDEIDPSFRLLNHCLVSLLNEAHLMFMQDKGFPELAIDGLAFINTDLEIIYESDASHRDVLAFEVAATNLHKYGCEFVYRVTNRTTGKVTAVAKTGMLFYNYQQAKVAEVPARFKAICK